MTYHVLYKMFDGSVKGIDVSAKSKDEAVGKALYDAIPKKEGEMPYDAWAVSVTYQNGNYKKFDN